MVIGRSEPNFTHDLPDLVARQRTRPTTLKPVCLFIILYKLVDRDWDDRQIYIQHRLSLYRPLTK